jgi:hypothetical protein
MSTGSFKILINARFPKTDCIAHPPTILKISGCAQRESFGRILPRLNDSMQE